MNKNSQYKEEMRQHYQQWNKSNVSQNEYAEMHQLKIHTFRYWIQKFNNERHLSTGFIAIDTLIPTEINIRYPNGVELAMPALTSTKLIRELIQYGKLCSQ